MNTFHDEIFNLPEWSQLIQVSARLLVAALLGGCIGFERQRERKAAGLRTHILVAMGAALFTIGPLEAGMAFADLSRVFQGIATGIGFIGAGTILKLTEREEIKGLTTAAGLWLTAAIGMSVGSGLLWIPVLATFFAFVILSVLGHAERWAKRERKAGRPRAA
jgi:putative Mg2+ transporter-C (MgtC) family protein